MGTCGGKEAERPAAASPTQAAGSRREVAPWLQASYDPGDEEQKRRHDAMEKWHAIRRAAMEDTGGGAGRKIASLFFDNAAADWLESAAESGGNKALERMVQGKRIDFGWGTRWKKIGQRMKWTDPATGAEQELEVKFGENMRKLYFRLQPFFLNSASYGATPKPVLEARRLREDSFQDNPVYWRFTTFPLMWTQAKADLAKFVGCDNDYLEIMPNANAASNTVLKSLPWHWGDKILIFSVEYEATELACDWLMDTYGVKTEKLDLTPPMTDDEVLKAVDAKLKELKTSPGGLPKLVNFCHVTSKTAWIFPAKRIVELCKKYGCSVMVDGAQAAGHLDISVRNIGADWYVGTVHKWMYSCPGVAFLVVQPHKQPCTSPQTVSYFAGKGFDKEFSYYGLQDWSVWLTVIDGLNFVENVCGGWSNVRKYCQSQADQVAGWCMEVWKAQGLTKGPKWLGEDWCQPIQGKGRYGQMPIIPLPWPHDRDAEQADAVSVMGSLMLEDVTAFTLAIPVKGNDGKEHVTLAIRCPCQIFLSESDWKRMAENVAQFKGNYGKGEVAQDALGKLLPFLADSETEQHSTKQK